MDNARIPQVNPKRKGPIIWALSESWMSEMIAIAQKTYAMSFKLEFSNIKTLPIIEGTTPAPINIASNATFPLDLFGSNINKIHAAKIIDMKI